MLPFQSVCHDAPLGPPNPLGPAIALLRQPQGTGLDGVSQLVLTPV